MTPITINLDDKLIQFVKQFAKENNMTQREVIEQALEKARKEKLKQEIIKYSQEIANDKELQKEIMWLANAGLEDYNNSLKKIENEK